MLMASVTRMSTTPITEHTCKKQVHENIRNATQATVEVV